MESKKKFNLMNSAKQYENSDERYTKPEVIYPLLKYIPKDKIIWCPCDLESSYFVRIFKENNINVVHSHIFLGQDFYEYEPKNWDILITNPPFFTKRKFIERCISFNKPFCVLLPLTWINDTTPYNLFKDIDLQLMIFDKRTDFINSPKLDKISFKSGYYARDFFDKQIVFERIRKT